MDIIKKMLINFKKQKENCPYEQDSNRTSVQEVLDQMLKLNPHAKSSLLRSMMNVQPDYLPQPVDEQAK